jgi:hypothetical protein
MMSVQPLVIVVSATPLEQELKEYDEEVPSMVERILRKKGPEILSVVGEAPIFQMQEMREFPSFTRDGTSTTARHCLSYVSIALTSINYTMYFFHNRN